MDDTPAATTPPAESPAALNTGDHLPPFNEYLSDKGFEDFTELLLNASKFTDAGVLHTTSVVRWGKAGEKQHGIDFAGTLSDGRTATWQCKRYENFTAGQVTKVVEEVAKNGITADVHHLVLSCEASVKVRQEIDKHPQWVLLDQRGLKQALDDIHAHKRRDVLDETFGADVRGLLMTSPGQDLILSVDAFAKHRLAPNTVLNDVGPFAGRRRELRALLDALKPDAASPRVVLVTGPGGRGKTRLLLEGLRQVQQRNPERPVLLSAPGTPLTQETVQALPQSAAVVVVDDIHQAPQALVHLVRYLLAVPGAQVVLGCRPSGIAEVQAALAERFFPRDLQRIEVDRLTILQARKLVDGLAEGLGLDFPLRNFLAEQAVDTSYFSVIAVNLIRQGELSSALAVDAGLRQAVLSHYRDVAIGMVDGVSREHVDAVLAVYAVLHGVRTVDDAVDPLIVAYLREYTGLGHRHLLHIIAALEERGILVTRQGVTTVVPEVLGDHTVENEAVIGGRDSGFAVEIWQRFGQDEGPLLLASLAELEWRLQQREGGGPQVLTRVWADLREHLLRDDLDEVQHYLRSLERLPLTHPEHFLGLLEELRTRLVGMIDAAAEGGEQHLISPARRRRTLFALVPTEPADVLQMLAPLYGQCAARQPALLEAALDALWSLHRLPQQRPDNHWEHPERVIADMLADLGQLPDPSFPQRIVAAVERYLTEPAPGQEPEPARWGRTSPLFMLRPLLAKQVTTRAQSAPRTIMLSEYLIPPTAVAPLRDRIRAVLLQQAAGADLRRAGEAVDLLHQMLLPLRPVGRAIITSQLDRAWQGDELATVVTLTRAAEQTTSSAVRRHIRHEVCWSSAHAHSLPARQQALALVTALDQRVDDDVAEGLMPEGLDGTRHRRGLRAPTLSEMEQLAAARMAQRARCNQLGHEAAAADDEADVETAYDRHLQDLTDAQSRALAQLTQLSSPAEAIAVVAAAAYEVAAVTRVEEGRVQVGALLSNLAEAMPERIPDLLIEILAGQAGPLDSDVDSLVERWRQHDSQAALSWMRSLAAQRPEVRRAIARGWRLHPWLEADPAYEEIYDQAVTDADDLVRLSHLMSAFYRHRDEPSRAAHVLLASDATDLVCEQALKLAALGRPQEWGAALDAQAAELVLQLVNRAGWDDWTLQKIAAGVAGTHPTLVLRYIADRETIIGHRVERKSLPAALEAQSEQTSGWLVETCAGLSSSARQHLAEAAFPSGLGPGVTEALSRGIESADSATLIAIADCLQSVSLWPTRRPELARALLRRARLAGASVAAELLTYLGLALRVDSYSFNDGVSKELQTAQSLCEHAAMNEVDVDLRRLFASAEQRLASQIADHLQEYKLEEEEEEEEEEEREGVLPSEVGTLAAIIADDPREPTAP